MESIKLKSITYEQYKALDETEQGAYNFAFLYAKECEQRDVCNIGPLTKQTFGFVKDLQQASQSSNIFDVVFLFFKEKVVSLNVFEYYAFYCYILEQLKFISKLEHKELNMEQDPDAKAAGADDFERFGPVMQIDKLAGGDVTKYDAIRNMSYEYCLTKLALITAEYNFNTRLMRIKQNRG